MHLPTLTVLWNCWIQSNGLVHYQTMWSNWKIFFMQIMEMCIPNTVVKLKRNFPWMNRKILQAKHLQKKPRYSCASYLSLRVTVVANMFTTTRMSDCTRARFLARVACWRMAQQSTYSSLFSSFSLK